MKLNLYTIGYEGMNINQFISRLKEYNINTLVDVREIPLSRKKGFSKSLLTEKLNNNGIEYIHTKELGSPKSIRNKLREDSDYNYFFKAFSKHLKQNKHILEALYNDISESISCIMCFENSADTCHRSLVADRLKKINGNGLSIVNL